MNIKNTIITAVILASSFSCNSNFLEEKMHSQLGPSNFYKNAEDARKAVNGIYDGFQGNEYYGTNMWDFIDYPTEYLTNFWANKFDRYTFENDENQSLLPFWNRAWNVNNRANSVIDRTALIEDISDEDRSSITGEAKFLRALNYFNLVRMFGNLPLINTETTKIDENQMLPQNSRDEIYQQIISDLLEAEAGLPYEQEDIGRATKGAAQTLLGKVYLTYAGFYLEPESGELKKGDPLYFQLAADKLKEVIDEGVYGLEEEYEDIFSESNEYGKEVVFAVRYLEGTGGFEGGEGNSFTPIWVPKGAGIALVEWKTGATTKAFYDSYPTDDTRRDANFMLSYIDRNGATIEYPNAPMTLPHIRKYLRDIQEGENPSFSAIDGKDYGADFIVLRYADVLLMYSEALNELNDPNALWGINQVRSRANIEALSSLDQEALRAQILQERKWELCVEGHGWFDYTRMGVLLESNHSEGDKPGYNYPTKRNYLYPIPFNTMITNPNLNQNFGY